MDDESKFTKQNKFGLFKSEIFTVFILFFSTHRMSNLDEIIQVVRAIDDYNGGSTDLMFKRGDIIHVSQKDGVGWAFGKLDDGSFGWFPLEKVELVTESELSESEQSELSEKPEKLEDVSCFH